MWVMHVLKMYVYEYDNKFTKCIYVINYRKLTDKLIINLALSHKYIKLKFK